MLALQPIIESLIEEQGLAVYANCKFGTPLKNPLNSILFYPAIVIFNSGKEPSKKELEYLHKLTMIQL